MDETLAKFSADIAEGVCADVQAGVDESEVAVEDILSRLAEIEKLAELIREDSSRCRARAMPNARASVTTKLESHFEIIDRIEDRVNQLCSELNEVEARVNRAELTVRTGIFKFPTMTTESSLTSVERLQDAIEFSMTKNMSSLSCALLGERTRKCVRRPAMKPVGFDALHPVTSWKPSWMRDCDSNGSTSLRNKSLHSRVIESDLSVAADDSDDVSREFSADFQSSALMESKPLDLSLKSDVVSAFISKPVKSPEDVELKPSVGAPAIGDDENNNTEKNFVVEHHFQNADVHSKYILPENAMNLDLLARWAGYRRAIEREIVAEFSSSTGRRMPVGLEFLCIVADVYLKRLNEQERNRDRMIGSVARRHRSEASQAEVQAFIKRKARQHSENPFPVEEPFFNDDLSELSEEELSILLAIRELWKRIDEIRAEFTALPVGRRKTSVRRVPRCRRKSAPQVKKVASNVLVLPSIKSIEEPPREETRERSESPLPHRRKIKPKLKAEAKIREPDPPMKTGYTPTEPSPDYVEQKLIPQNFGISLDVQGKHILDAHSVKEEMVVKREVNDDLTDRTSIPLKPRITEADLKDCDRMGVLFFDVESFGTGYIEAVEVPMYFRLRLHRERSNRDRFLSIDEVTDILLMEVVATEDTIRQGSRVCAKWSRQVGGLFPGTVSSPPKDGEVWVDFDDGDSGSIPLKDVRLLPADYPIMVQVSNPVTNPRKRRRTSSSSRLNLPVTPPLESNLHDMDLKPSTLENGDSFCEAEVKIENGHGVCSADEFDGDSSDVKIWEWSDESNAFKRFKLGRKKRIFHEEICRGSEERIRVGDCAVFRTGDPDSRPYIGRILQFWEACGKRSMSVRVSWFYRPDETKGLASSIPHNGLFSSTHTDENDVRSIARKCIVVSHEEYKKARNRDGAMFLAKSAQVEPSDVYFCAGEYDPVSEKIVLRVPFCSA
ncbi:unnamed protein product [Notodromas monacha]|uniref:BAH domain-containing protein n=1 Tax=Notodromas monacha TaxID=399045 RepID=A0A7R9BI60_9CRUS|nr:unnamed protein product [Notodromas monacha]CAG0914883.1 unnamed protein product [Notodromas monacha]